MRKRCEISIVLLLTSSHQAFSGYVSRKNLNTTEHVVFIPQNGQYKDVYRRAIEIPQRVRIF